MNPRLSRTRPPGESGRCNPATPLPGRAEGGRRWCRGRLGQVVKILLATYAHVICGDDDRVRAIVDRSLGGSAEDWLRTEAVEGHHD